MSVKQFPKPQFVNAADKALWSLSRWFAAEAKRLYGMLDEPPAERVQTELIKFIRRRCGKVTGRDLKSGIRRIRKAELALRYLVEADLGEWIDIPHGPKGGRSAQEFQTLSVTLVSTISTNQDFWEVLLTQTQA